MLVHITLSVILLWINLGICVTSVARPMQQWTDKDDKDAWDQRPTWYDVLPANDQSGLSSHEALLNLANEYYNWVFQQPYACGNYGSSNQASNDKTCTILVAVMYDPLTQKTYASTIPKGPIKGVMATNVVLNGVAPLWYAQFITGNQVTTDKKGKNNNFHAEDGVFYNFEKALDQPLPNGRYPPGSRIAVWGKFVGEVKTPRDRIGQDVSLCSTSRNPSCQDIANGLGVQYRGAPIPSPPPLPQPTPGSDDEGSSDSDPFSSPGITDADYIAAMEMISRQ